MANHPFGRRALLRMAVLGPISACAAAKSHLVYWGTYTEGGGQFGNGESKGIYVSHMDASSGKLSIPEAAAESANPSWLAIHPNRRFLYAVNERLETPAKVLPGEV